MIAASPRLERPRFVFRPGMAASQPMHMSSASRFQNTHGLAEEHARSLGRRPCVLPRTCIPTWAGGIPACPAQCPMQNIVPADCSSLRDLSSRGDSADNHASNCALASRHTKLLQNSALVTNWILFKHCVLKTPHRNNRGALFKSF